jgi:hypothetical protein
MVNQVVLGLVEVLMEEQVEMVALERQDKEMTVAALWVLLKLDLLEDELVAAVVVLEAQG